MLFPRLALALALAALATPGESAIPRSRAARAAFQRAHACPATGETRGPCPGYVVDHIEPLCAGGADAPANMQWQALEDSRVKDRLERAFCRATRGQTAQAK